jgi:hypothetical protein
VKASPVWMKTSMWEILAHSVHIVHRELHSDEGESTQHPIHLHTFSAPKWDVSMMWGKILSLKERGHVFNLNARCQKHFYWRLYLEVFSTECCRHQYCGLYEMCRTTGKPLLRVKWGPERGRLDMAEGVGFGVDVPLSVALTVGRDARGDSVLAQCAPWRRELGAGGEWPVRLWPNSASVPRALRWG